MPKILKIAIEKLQHWLSRELRPSLIEEKKEVKENGYYEDSELLVVPAEDSDKYNVIAGNHRLKGAKELGIAKLPCKIKNVDKEKWLKKSIQDNKVNKTFAEDDMFDWLYRIENLNKKGLTYKKIAEKLNNSQDHIKKYGRLLNKIVPQVLDKAKKHQKGRGTKKVPSGTFEFTEGWFRNSGLYALEDIQHSKHLSSLYSIIRLILY